MGAVSRPDAMTKAPRRRKPPAPDDAALWDHVVREVTPLKRRARKAPEEKKPVPAAKIRAKPKPVAAVVRPAKPEKPRAAELVANATPGVDRRTAARLRRGEMEIDARIDLHGFTLQKARSRLFAFIARAQDRGLRCVLVITGKGLRGEGGGVIRNELPHWLNDRDLRPGIVAFTEAQPRDGGSGAFYVYLRRRRAP
jgi:DNA-nicking Smr family endonuclease